MKAIKPISFWVNGAKEDATLLKLTLIHDNLNDTATFHYELVSSKEYDEEVETDLPNIPRTVTVYNTLAQGNAIITGEEYVSWGNEQSINDDAYTIVAGKINVELV